MGRSRDEASEATLPEGENGEACMGGPSLARDGTDDLGNIGFNSQEERGQDSLHVQTEVIVKDEIVVRTLVARRGAVLGVLSSSLRRDEQNDAARTTEVAQAQHDAALADVRRGKYDGGGG